MPPLAKQRVDDLWEGLSGQAKATTIPMSAGSICRSTHKGSEQPWIIPDKDMGGGTEKGKLRIGEDRLCMRCGGSGQSSAPTRSAPGHRACRKPH